VVEAAAPWTFDSLPDQASPRVILQVHAIVVPRSLREGVQG
jgi:hypothetical protein